MASEADNTLSGAKPGGTASLPEAADQQPGTDRKHQSDRDLDGDQQAHEAPAAARRAAPTAVLLECALEVGPGELRAGRMRWPIR